MSEQKQPPQHQERQPCIEARMRPQPRSYLIPGNISGGRGRKLRQRRTDEARGATGRGRRSRLVPALTPLFI